MVKVVPTPGILFPFLRLSIPTSGMTVPSPSPEPETPDSTYAERVAFVVWYAQLVLGTEGPTKLGRAIGKADNTINKWMAAQPSFDQSAVVARAVGVSPSWLHNPQLPEAVTPRLFDEWLAARRAALQPAPQGMPPAAKSQSVSQLIAGRDVRKQKPDRTA